MEKEKDIWSILRRHYPENEYALMEEVRDKAGYYASRSADFIAVNLWPSRGLTIDGIELKSFRSDWLSELKKPEKAENIFQYCDYFWLLTADDTIAKLEEIPATWGWKCIKGEKITIKKDAPQLTPKPVSRHFMCAMLKRASDKSNYVRTDSITDKIEDAKIRGEELAEQRHKHQLSDFQKLKKIVDQFNEASGINIESYWHYGDKAKKTGDLVRFLQDGGADSIEKKLLALEPTVQSLLKQIVTGLELLKQTNGKLQSEPTA